MNLNNYNEILEARRKKNKKEIIIMSAIMIALGIAAAICATILITHTLEQAI
jgi:hypothetical protein